MKLTIKDGRDHFYTFDSNRILLLTATDEENIRQVEFSTEENGEEVSWTSEVLTGSDGVKYVQVPNEFLNGDYTRLVCYYVALDSNGEYTRQKEIFRIRARQEPEDYFLTYSERVTFASIKALVEQYKATTKEYMDTTNSYMDNADRSAKLAEKYAENNEDVAVEPGKYSAKHWSIKAEAAKKTAVQKATEAGTSEGNAKTYMESAQSAKQDAETAKNDANTILERVQSKGTEITNFVATSKTEIETQKDESVNAVRSVYTEDLNELKGDLNGLEVTDIDGITMIDGFVHIASGYINASDLYSATNYINVIPKSTVLLKNYVIKGNAGICGYSITKEFIASLTGTLVDNGRLIEIPEHVHYIRVSAKRGNVVSAKYVNNHKLNDRIKDFVFNLPTDISYTKNENQVMAKNGTLVDKTGYGHTNYIEVLGGKTVVVKGVTGYEYCGVILFDKSKRIISYIEAPSRFGYIEQTEIILPFNCAYIVANIVLHNTNAERSHFYVYYKEELNLIDEKINNHKDELLNDIQVNKDEFIQGYYYGISQNYVKDDRFAVSPKVYVCDDTNVIFHQYAHVNSTSVTFFDATGKLVERREGVSGTSRYNEVVHIPLGTAYMIYTVLVEKLSEHYVTYAEPYKSDYQINKYVGEWIKNSKLNLSSIFSKCNRPILTLIDDDTVSIDAVRAFKNACDNLGVKGTYATVARTLEQNEELTNELLSYEKEGFHIAFHAYNQSAVSGGDRYVSFQDAVDGIRFFNSKGFLDFMYWVYPYGIAHQEEARKLGFKCGVLADNDSLETCQDGRFNLKRVEVYTDGDYPTASEIKAMIDEAVANGSWLITETHFHYSDNPVEKFNEIVQYALDSGMEVMTLNDAFRLKEPIYRLYDMF